MTAPSNNPWPPERVDELKRLVQEGGTASQIAAAMGVTRNTIIAKLNRLGVPLRGSKQNSLVMRRHAMAAAKNPDFNQPIKRSPAPRAKPAPSPPKISPLEAAFADAAPPEKRDAEKHYAVMRLDDIAALPVADVAAADAHLFLWTTGPCLRQSFEVMDAWGFRYSAVGFTWIKLRRAHNPLQLRVIPMAEADLHVGLGLTTRKNAEFCLLGRRGNARRIARDVREVILAPVREHSRKPDEAYARMERYCDGPRLELFARQTRAGWTGWGAEVGKFDRVAA